MELEPWFVENLVKLLIKEGKSPRQIYATLKEFELAQPLSPPLESAIRTHDTTEPAPETRGENEAGEVPVLPPAGSRPDPQTHARPGKADPLSTAKLEAARIWLIQETNLLVQCCTYCGCYWENVSLDHLLPRAAGYERSRVPAVPSCIHCNSTLGEYITPVISERCYYLERRMQKNLAKYMKTPYRSMDQINEYGRNLRSYIAGSQLKKLYASRRITILKQGGIDQGWPTINHWFLHDQEF